MPPPVNLPNYSLTNVDTPIVSQRDGWGSDPGSYQLRGANILQTGLTMDTGRTPDLSNPLNVMYGTDDMRQGALNQSVTGTSSSSSYAHARSTIRYACCFTWQSSLSLQQVATTRIMKFNTRDQPRLLRSQFDNKAIHVFIQFIHRLIRADTFDETVIEAYIDEESINHLTTLFTTTTVAITNPMPSHRTTDWDVATIVDAMEELYSLQAEHRHLTLGVRWEAVVQESRRTVEILQANMELARQNPLKQWNIGPIPVNQRYKTLKGLSGCFTHRDNPFREQSPNEHF